MTGLLSKERLVARPGFNRWWNIAAALAINLCIGQAYAFSVFNPPLTRVLGVSEPLPQDWKLSELGWIFTLAYVFLGLWFELSKVDSHWSGNAYCVLFRQPAHEEVPAAGP